MSCNSGSSAACGISDNAGASNDLSCDSGSIRLRPHHLLCIQKFTGHGYDEMFTAFMTKLVLRLRTMPNEEVFLISGCDDLCTACPNNINGNCSSLQKVGAMDRKVLSSCGLSAKASARWLDLVSLAKEKVLDGTAFYEICGECQWFELCKNTSKGFYDE